MYMDMVVVTRAEEAIAGNEDLNGDDIELLVKSSLIGSQLYAPEAVQIQSSQYIADIERRLYELEINHFGPDFFLDFKRVCAHQAEALDETYKEFDGKHWRCAYLSGHTRGLVNHPNDEWQFRVECRAKTIAISIGSLVRTKFEEMLYGAEAPIDGVPSTITVPASLIYDAANGREFLNSRMGEGWQSVRSMKQCFKANYNEALKLDPSLWQDLHFIEEEFEPLMEEKLKKCLMSCLPGDKEKRSVAKAVVACRLLSTGNLASAQQTSLQKSLTAATNLLQDIADGKSPSGPELAKLGDFVVCFAKKAEHFAHCPNDDPASPPSSSKVKEFFGAEAVKFRWQICQAMPGLKPEEDIKMFRMFRWVLSAQEDLEFLAWEKAAVIGAKARLQESKAKALKDVEAGDNSSGKGKRIPICDEILAPPLRKKEKKAPPCQKIEPPVEEIGVGQEDLAVGGAICSFFGANAI